jgi:hypothetical protein
MHGYWLARGTWYECVFIAVMVVEFDRNEKVLVDLTEEIRILTIDMDRLIISIQEIAKFHRTCGIA